MNELAGQLPRFAPRPVRLAANDERGGDVPIHVRIRHLSLPCGQINGRARHQLGYLLPNGRADG